MSRQSAGGRTPWVMFYTSDFLAGTSGMTAACKGVYITLLCLIYESEKPLTQRWEILARRCGCTLPAFKRALAELEDDGKIEVTDAGIWSPKCEKHIAQRRERRGSAKAAADTRWEKTKENQGEGDAGAMRTHCQPEPQPQPQLSEGAKAPSRRSPSPLDGFDEFWALWPSKKNKDAARKAWRKLAMQDRRAAYAAIRDGWFEKWRASQPDANPIHASSYLNGRRWNDEFDAPALKVFNGGSNGKPGHDPYRLQRIVQTAAGGTSSQDWG